MDNTTYIHFLWIIIYYRNIYFFLARTGYSLPRIYHSSFVTKFDQIPWTKESLLGRSSSRISLSSPKPHIFCSICKQELFPRATVNTVMKRIFFPTSVCIVSYSLLPTKIMKIQQKLYGLQKGIIDLFIGVNEWLSGYREEINYTGRGKLCWNSFSPPMVKSFIVVFLCNGWMQSLSHNKAIIVHWHVPGTETRDK